jgi:acyl-homoserine lactone acylase PvdQ
MNMGDCKGWIGLSPPAAYPLTEEREMHLPVPLYPGTTPAYKETTHIPLGL